MNKKASRFGSSRNRLTKASIAMAIDAIGKQHYKPSPDSSARAHRFINIQRSFLHGKIEFPCALTQLQTSFVLFDGILTRADLELATAAVGQAYYCEGELTIDWSDKLGRINRRYISKFTANALLNHLGSPGKSDLSITGMEQALARFYVAYSNKIDAFLEDAQAYAFQFLPGFLFAHCVNMAPLGAIPRSALARYSSGKALQVDEEKIPREYQVGLSKALDGYFAADKLGGEEYLVGEIVRACRERKNLPHAIAKSRMLEDCLALSERIIEAGKIGSILLAWVIDFIEYGTPGYPRYAPSSISGYVRAIIPPLYRELKKVEIELLEVSQFEEIYVRILSSLPPSRCGIAAAALNAWHYFIVTMLDVPELRISLHKGITPLIAKANAIWPKEINTIMQWLNEATIDERMKNQLITAFSIAADARIRAAELLRLRLGNARIYEDAIEIDINPLKRDPKVKTLAGRRTIRVTDPAYVNHIREWVKRRGSEGGISTDLFFGDPYAEGKGYKLGQLYYFMNRLLKDVTGDPSASLHTLSHDVISRSYNLALGFEKTDVNPFDQASADAGHASSVSGFKNYYYRFEGLIRNYLDLAIKSIGLPGKVVERYSKITSANFRKRCSRSKNTKPANDIAWDAIRQHAVNLQIPDVSTQFNLVDASPPPFLSNQRKIRFDDCLHIIQDLAVPLSVITISSRSSMSEKLIYKIASLCCETFEALGLLDRSPTGRSNESSIRDFLEVFPLNGKQHFQCCRCNQEKYKPLMKYLCKQGEPQLISAAGRSWLSCFKNGYISLDRPSAGMELMRLLYTSEIPSSRVLVYLAEPPSTISKSSLLKSQIEALWKSVYVVPPIFQKISPRRGRPISYLSISGVDLFYGQNVGCAATSVSGLNALMLAASVYCKVAHDEQVDISEAGRPTMQTAGDHHG